MFRPFSGLVPVWQRCWGTGPGRRTPMRSGT